MNLPRGMDAQLSAVHRWNRRDQLTQPAMFETGMTASSPAIFVTRTTPRCRPTLHVIRIRDAYFMDNWYIRFCPGYWSLKRSEHVAVGTEHEVQETRDEAEGNEY